MKTLIILSVILFNLPSAFACNHSAIVFNRSHSYSLSTQNNNKGYAGGLENEVQIPFRIGSERGCFTQKSGLDFDLKYKRGKFSGEFNVYPPRVEFEKLPGEVTTYALLETTNSSLNLDSISIDIVSFTCSGESTLAVEGYAGSIGNLEVLKTINTLNMDIGVTFATGIAARNLRENRAKQSYQRKKIIGAGNFLTQRLTEIFNERLRSKNIELTDLNKKISNIPSVHFSTSLGTGAIDFEHRFDTVVATKAGCSKEFKSLMGDLLISKRKSPLKFENAEIKVKKNHFRVKLKEKKEATL